MSNELNDLSYVVMNLIGRNGAGPHDLVQMARRGQRLFWAGAESKIYEQPKRLERLGYLVSEKTPGKTRERTHYRLTDKGIAALREWLARPTSRTVSSRVKRVLQWNAGHDIETNRTVSTT